MAYDKVRKGIYKETLATPLQKEAAINLARQLGSVKKAAQELNISDTALRGWLRKAGDGCGHKKDFGGKTSGDYPEEVLKRPNIAIVNDQSIIALSERAKRASEVQMKAIERIERLIESEENIGKLASAVSSLQQIIKETGMDTPESQPAKNIQYNVQNNLVLSEEDARKSLVSVLAEWEKKNKES